MNDIKNTFDEVSKNYDFLNNVISFNTHFLFKKYVVNQLNLKNGIKVLDLCCGTADVSKIIKKKYSNISVIGVDFSSNMLNIAKMKVDDVVFIEADATNLPFSDEEFDVVIVGFGLRNIPEIELALSEVYRVLKKEGQFLNFDFDKTSPLFTLWEKVTLFLLNFFLSELKNYKYLMKSIKEFCATKELIEKFISHGFKPFKQGKMLFDIVSYQIVKK